MSNKVMWKISNPKQKCIMEAVKKYASLAETDLKEFMSETWNYLCGTVGLCANSDDNTICTYDELVDLYNGDPELQDQFETSDDYIDYLFYSSNDWYQLNGEECDPTVGEYEYNVFCDFFIVLFTTLGLNDIANEVKELKQ